MVTSRRQLLQLGLVAAAGLPLFAAGSRAQVQAYPARPVRLIVGFPAGGADDIFSRLIAQWLSERLSQQFIVENRPGAGSTIAADAVFRSPADGYTLLTLSAPTAISSQFYDNLSFDLVHDFAPVAGIVSVDFLMLVNPEVPAATVPEFIAYAKDNAKSINMGSAGIGTPHHIAGELFKLMTGVNMVHVPYRGDAPALTDLIGGQIQVLFGNVPSSLEHIKAGRLRPLAMVGVKRSTALPDLPLMADFLPGFDVSGWVGMAAPKGTPVEIVERLNREINGGLASPRIASRIAELGVAPLTGMPAAFGAIVASEAERARKVIRTANLKL